MDAASGVPHGNILVQLYRAYGLGCGLVAAACAFLREAPNRTAAARIALRPLVVHEEPDYGPIESLLGVFDVFHPRNTCGVTLTGQNSTKTDHAHDSISFVLAFLWAVESKK